MVEPYYSLHLNFELLLVYNFRVFCHATAARTVEVLDDHGELHRLKLELREVGSQIVYEEVFWYGNPGHCASLFHLLPGRIVVLDGWANKRYIALLVEVVTDFETGIPIRSDSIAYIEDQVVLFVHNLIELLFVRELIDIDHVDVGVAGLLKILVGDVERRIWEFDGLDNADLGVLSE